MFFLISLLKNIYETIKTNEDKLENQRICHKSINFSNEEIL